MPSLLWASCSLISYLLLNKSASLGSPALHERLYPQEQLVIGWNLLLSVAPVVEVYAGKSAVGVYLDSAGAAVVSSECLLAEVLEVELNFVPAFVKLERHGTEEWLDASYGLEVAALKRPPEVLVIEYLNLETEVLVELNHLRSTFLASNMIMGREMSSDSFSFIGRAMKFALTFMPSISNTGNCSSSSVMRLMWPFRTDMQ